jgi:hypothetical protein
LVIKALDPDWIRIRIRIGVRPKMLDPDPDEMNEDPQPCIEISPKITAFLFPSEFVYLGEVSVSQKHLQSFLKTASLLRIRGLAEDAEQAALWNRNCFLRFRFRF